MSKIKEELFGQINQSWIAGQDKEFDDAYHYDKAVLALHGSPRQHLVSDCCGAAAVSNGDADSQDIGICPECKDHCTYVESEE